MGTIKRSLRNIANVARGVPAVMLGNLLLTRRCTQRCLQCTIPHNLTDPPTMPLEHYRLLIDKLDRHGTQFINLSGGEPILHPQLDECMRHAAGKRFVHVQMLSTLYGPKAAVEKAIEALFETRTGVQVSFDGFDEVADRIRGAKNVSRTVQESMELVTRENARHKGRVRTSVNIVISRLNVHQVPEVLKYVESLGWKCNVDIYRWRSENAAETDEMKLEDGDEFRRALDAVRKSPIVTTPRVIVEGFADAIRGEVPKRCPYLETRGLGSKIYINPDGSVDVCMGRPFGNLIEGTIEELFSSEAWRKRLNEMRACRGCWNNCYTHPAIVFHPKSGRDLRTIWETVKSA